MSRTTEVESGPAGPVVVRRAIGPDAPGLRRIGERLVAAAHPGVVEVLSSGGSEQEWELRLAHAGHPVGLMGQLSPERVAAIAAAVATTLADLHAIGLVHGAVEPSHVLVGAHGRPVLCGLVPEVDGREPTDDVAALGALMVSLLGPGDDPVVLPQRRWARTRPTADWSRRSLLLLADHACAEPSSRRPSARRLAAEISEAVPGAVLEIAPAAGPDGDDPMGSLRPEVGDEAPPPRLSALAGAVVGVVLLGAVGVQLARPHSESADTATPAPTTSVLEPGARPACVPLPAAHGSGSGCATPVEVDGSLVRVGEVRYQVGEPGDVVALGDWDCEGGATPAVLRPSTGEVFVFDSWAGEADVAVGATDRVDGADELVVEGASDGCDRLIVVRADGTRQPVSNVGRA